jgi:phenylacetate-CoA ligase
MLSLDATALRGTRGVDLTVWPPRYDPAYRPAPDAEHWLPEIECAEPAARDALIFAKLTRQVSYAWERSAFYRSRWQEAGVSPDTLKSLDDLARFPVVQKAELRQAQAAAPPFGDYLCIEPAEVARIHGTSGTTGRPTVFGIGAADWGRIAEAHARILWGAGIRPGDRILICSFFSLYLGSWGALAGGERLGATVFPFGAGAQGQTVQAVQWARDLRPSAFYGTPSYALHFAETARRESIDPRSLGFRILFLLGRAGRRHPGHPRAHRGDLRRPLRGHGQHGRDDPLDDQRRVPPPHRHASLAGSRLHPGLRPGDVPAAALRRRGHARVHSPRADLTAHDPARLR